VELVQLHHALMLRVMRGGAKTVASTSAAAGQLLRDALSAFDLVQHGLWEEHNVTRSDRRRATF